MNLVTKIYQMNFEDFYQMESSKQFKLFFDKKIIALKSHCKPPSVKQIKSLCLKFGSLYRNPCGKNFFVNEDPYILRVSENRSKDNIKGLFHNFELNWHSDFAHTNGDFHGTLLYNKKNGSKAVTYFIDTQKAFQSLSVIFKRKYRKTKLNHFVSTKAFVNKKIMSSEKRLLKMKNYRINGYFSPACLNEKISRPLFFKHPKTNKHSIYLSPATVDELPLKQDYSLILSHLMKYSQPFYWEKNDCILFDNLSSIHSRSSFKGFRELYRLQFNYAKH